MSVNVQNIFRDCRAAAGEEEFVTLCENASVKIERIVSHSHSSPENVWDEQDEDEWVMIVRGAATLEFAGGELVELKAGDYLMIPRTYAIAWREPEGRRSGSQCMSNRRDAVQSSRFNVQSCG